MKGNLVCLLVTRGCHIKTDERGKIVCHSQRLKWACFYLFVLFVCFATTLE